MHVPHRMANKICSILKKYKFVKYGVDSFMDYCACDYKQYLCIGLPDVFWIVRQGVIHSRLKVSQRSQGIIFEFLNDTVRCTSDVSADVSLPTFVTSSLSLMREQKQWQNKKQSPLIVGLYQQTTRMNLLSLPPLHILPSYTTHLSTRSNFFTC